MGAELAGGERAADQLLKAARKVGISDRTLQRARAQIATARKSSFTGGWVWQLLAAEASSAPTEDAKHPSSHEPGAFEDIGAFADSRGSFDAEGAKFSEGAKTPRARWGRSPDREQFTV